MLDKKNKVKHYIRINIHNTIILRFWMSKWCQISYMCNRCQIILNKKNKRCISYIVFLYYHLIGTPHGFIYLNVWSTINCKLLGKTSTWNTNNSFWHVRTFVSLIKLFACLKILTFYKYFLDITIKS